MDSNPEPPEIKIQNKEEGGAESNSEPVIDKEARPDSDQITEWIIDSPDRVRIIGCGGPSIELVKNIFLNYEDKLRGIKYMGFDKPTKQDYLDLRLTPDYRNIHAAEIKRQVHESLNQHKRIDDKRPESSEPDVGSRMTAEHKKIDNGSARSGSSADVEKRSIMDKVKSFLGSKTKAVENTDETAASSTKIPNNMESQEEDQRDRKVIMARKELRDELVDFLQDVDLMFFVTDLKSSNGLDNSLIASKYAKEHDIITIGLVFLPSRLDKLEEVEYDNRGLQALRLNADIIVVIPHLEALIEGYLVLTITELLELITTSGLVNLDVADIKTVAGRGNVAMLGFGSGRGQDHNKIMEAINEALNSPLLKLDLHGVNRTLVNVTGDNNMTITEAQKVAKVILSKIAPDARLIWGAAVSPKLSGAVKVMIMAGVLPKNILVHIYANS